MTEHSAPEPELRVFFPPDRKVKLLGFIMGLLMAFVMAVLATIAWSTIRAKDSAADQNEKDQKANRAVIMDLQSQIAMMNLSTERAKVRDASVIICTTLFTYDVQAKSGTLLSDLGNLVIIIATTVPGDQRDAAIGNGVELVKQAATAYTDSLKARSDYTLSGSPLPCPLTPDDPAEG